MYIQVLIIRVSKWVKLYSIGSKLIHFNFNLLLKIYYVFDLLRLKQIKLLRIKYTIKHKFLHLQTPSKRLILRDVDK